MSVWLLIVGAGIGTYLLRVSMVALLSNVETPVWVDRITSFVMPAAFAALAASAVLRAGGVASVESVPRVVAILVAIAVAHRTRSTPLTLTAGLGALWIATGLLAVA